MKTEMFVNATFPEQDQSVTVTARLRGKANSRSFKLVGVDPELGLEKNDGIAVELSGALKVTENYASPENFRILDVKKGAYVPRAVEISTDEYFQGLMDSEPSEEAPF